MLPTIDGATVVGVFSDNDTSGYSGKPRDGFDELVRLIVAGEVDVLVAWHVDRLTRRLIELAELIELCQLHGVTIATVVAGAFDPNNPSAVMSAQIAGSVAQYESSVKSERARSKHDELAGAGMIHGGVRRFGFNNDMSHREDEAAIVRELAGRLLAGDSLAACARSLTERGVESVRGGKWTGPNLRHMMLRPHLAGLRVHRGEVVGKGTWAPIFDVATHEALKLKLGDPTRRTSYSNARVHMLAGLAVCGLCGGALRGQSAGSSAAAYKCHTCHGVHRRMTDVHERVTDWVVARLAMADASGTLADDTAAVELAELTGKRRDIDARGAELGTAFATGALPLPAYTAASAALATELAQLDTAIGDAKERVAAPVRALDGLTGPTPDHVFTELALGRQRAVIDVLCTVTVNRAARKGAPFDPASVVITPK